MEELATFKARILYFIEQMGMPKTKFERIAQLGNGYLNNMRNDGLPTPAVLDRIFEGFPEMNREWFLDGKGEMLRPVPQGITINQTDNHNIGDVNGINMSGIDEAQSWKKLALDRGDEIEKLRARNEELEEQVKKLLGTVNEQTQQISTLISKL